MFSHLLPEEASLMRVEQDTYINRADVISSHFITVFMLVCVFVVSAVEVGSPLHPWDICLVSCS